MDILNTLSTMNLRRLNPNGGVLVCTTYWRPQPEDPDPEQPGEKASVLSYLLVKAKEDCPCGSGHLLNLLPTITLLASSLP
jgi:hypothetical protein